MAAVWFEIHQKAGMGYVMSEERDELIIIQALVNAVIVDAEKINNNNEGIDMFHTRLTDVDSRLQGLIEYMEEENYDEIN